LAKKSGGRIVADFCQKWLKRAGKILGTKVTVFREERGVNSVSFDGSC